METKNSKKIESAYFGHECFSDFTACCYLRATNRELVNENITVTSEANDHSRIAAHTCIMKIINEKEFCGKYSDPRVCDHPLFLLSFNPDNTCL